MNDMQNLPPSQRTATGHPAIWDQATKVYTNRLILDTTQRQKIDSIYSTRAESRWDLNIHRQDDQCWVQDRLVAMGLDKENRQKLDTRWAIRWSSKAFNGQAGRWRRILLQCKCGTSNSARRIQDSFMKSSAKTSTNDTDSGPRTSPYEYTGCLSHVEISEYDTGHISAVAGIFEHDDVCASVHMTRIPSVPLHNHVYEVALQQLSAGAGPGEVQTRNIQLIQKRFYRDMPTNAEQYSTLNVRYHLQPHDMQTLYRKFARSKGVDTAKPPQYNIHDWLDPSSPEFKPELKQAIFHYSPRAEVDDRLIVCISTPEMDRAAWRYAHQKQVILDGTFGLVSTRMLLFIALAVDEDNKGLPIAFFLFSAPSGNKATHAGYNTAILQEVLTQWRTHLESKSSQPFTPLVAITDTDIKERSALLNVWSGIWLILCKFHVRQCWTNKRKTLLKGTSFWTYHVRQRLRVLEERLLATVDYSVACRLIDAEHENLSCYSSTEFGISDAMDPSCGGLKFLEYLRSTWMPQELWCSWAQKGRAVASLILNIPIEGVIPTTNHLESFNFVLKNKHTKKFKRSNGRLRFDVFINVLVTSIIPEVYGNRQIQRNYSSWLSSRFRSSAGGVDLVALRKSTATHTDTVATASLLWWPADEKRQNDAILMAQETHMGRLQIYSTEDPDKMEAVCASSGANILDPSHCRYRLLITRGGHGSCECIDFSTRGGACKHLRLFRIYIDHYISQNAGLIAPFFYPTTVAQARAIQIAVPQPQALSFAHGTAVHGQPTSTYQDANIAASNVLSSISLLHSLADLDDSEDAHDVASDCGDDQEINDELIEERLLFSTPADVTYSLYAREDLQQGIQTQTQLKIEHGARLVLPKLHGIFEDMHDVLLHATPVVQEFSDVIQNLSLRISRSMCIDSVNNGSVTRHLATQSARPPLNTEVPSDAPQDQQIIPTPSTSGQSTEMVQVKGRFRPALRAPSPERAQKRKKSHGTM